jgi:hypothetical protein
MQKMYGHTVLQNCHVSSASIGRWLLDKWQMKSNSVYLNSYGLKFGSVPFSIFWLSMICFILSGVCLFGPFAPIHVPISFSLDDSSWDNSI